MTAQTPQALQKTTLPSDFKRSWELLLSSGRTVLALIEDNCWVQARHLRNRRIELSRRHFERFPVGPDNRSYYSNSLSELFAMELAIDNNLRNTPPTESRPAHLRLVSG